MSVVAVLGGGIGGLTAAHELMERGFEVEGTLRRHALRDGEWVDSLTMARLSRRR